MKYLSPAVGIAAVRPLVLIDANEWEAAVFAWRSPMWQASTWPAAWVFVEGSLAVRAVLEHEARTLLRVSAENGFWSLNASELKSVALNVGIPESELKNQSLLDLLEKLVRHLIPACTDEQATASLACRLTALFGATSTA